MNKIITLLPRCQEKKQNLLLFCRNSMLSYCYNIIIYDVFSEKIIFFFQFITKTVMISGRNAEFA